MIERVIIDPMLRLPEVRNVVGLSTATIYRLIAANEFPRPRRISRAAVAWPQSSIAAWLASRPTAGRR